MNRLRHIAGNIVIPTLAGGALVLSHIHHRITIAPFKNNKTNPIPRNRILPIELQRIFEFAGYPNRPPRRPHRFLADSTCAKPKIH